VGDCAKDAFGIVEYDIVFVSCLLTYIRFEEKAKGSSVNVLDALRGEKGVWQF
jgi:hypothetical protein